MKLNPSNTAIIKRLLSGRNSRPLQSILAKIEAADMASLLGQLTAREGKLLLLALQSIQRAHLALYELPENQIRKWLQQFVFAEQKLLLQSSPVEYMAHFLSCMSEEDKKAHLEVTPSDIRQKIMQIYSYPEDSAGQLMQPDVFSLPIKTSIQKALEVLRERAQQEASIYYIYCTTEDNKLAGVLSLRQLVTAPPDTPLESLIKKDLVTVFPETSSEAVARVVAHYDFIAVPVVNSEGELLGVITVDDVVDILQEQATADIYASVGLQEDDRVYSSPWFKIKARLPWMLLNLLLAALASSVVSLFEPTMKKLIVLASVKNIVAGLGGNTAIQSLTVVTRGLATGDFNFTPYFRAVLKELMVGITLGAITGVFAGLLIYLWKEDSLVAIVICISMLLNSIVASLAGSLVPLALAKFRMDPAVGSGVIVTMITDIFSFFSFLGIATIGLKLVGAY